jgi:hypothetical protein
MIKIKTVTNDGAFPEHYDRIKLVFANLFSKLLGTSHMSDGVDTIVITDSCDITVEVSLYNIQIKTSTDTRCVFLNIAVKEFIHTTSGILERIIGAGKISNEIKKNIIRDILCEIRRRDMPKRMLAYVYMIYIKSLSNNYIYIRNRHTASTSFTSYMYDSGVKDFAIWHIPISVYIKTLGADKVSSMYSFCFLRDPVEYYSSHFFWGVLNGKCLFPKTSEEAEDVIVSKIKENAYLSLITHEDEIVVKEIFPFTYLENSVSILKEKLGNAINKKEFPHHNRLATHRCFSESVAPRMHILKERMEPMLVEEYAVYNRAVAKFRENYNVP